MGILGTIKNWVKGVFDKVGKMIQKGWALASPFLKEFMSVSASLAMKSLQDLATAAIAQISTQGLPNDEAKRGAFEKYMRDALKKEGLELKDSEINLLRETALAIYKKATEK